MDRQAAANPLLLTGIIGLIAVIAFTIWLGPDRAFVLQAHVQSSVDAALSFEDYAWAKAKARGQSVELTGVAPSEEARNAAAKAASTASGVSVVRLGGVDVAAPVTPYVWRAARSVDGAIILEGVAPTRAALAAIEETAHMLYGEHVESRMTLATGAPKGVNWELAAISGLDALQHLSTGSAELRGDHLTVSGFAPDDATVEDVAAKLARAGAGVTANSDVVGPAEWTAKLLANGKLTFSGRAASEAAKTQLARAISSSVGRDNFDDQTSLGKAGSWSPRVSAGLADFTRFKSGEINVQGRIIHVAGEASGWALANLKDDFAKVADSYTVTYSVKESAPSIPEISGLDLPADGSATAENCQTAFSRLMAKNQIGFETGRGGASLGRQNGELPDKLVEVARRCSAFRIEVDGYADAGPKRLAAQRNAQERAQAVVAYLQSRGVPAQQLAASLGADKPTAKGKIPPRRIEFKISSAEKR